MTLQVRQAHPDDARRIVAFQLAMAAETEGLTLNQTSVQRGVGAVFDDPRLGQYWVAQADGQVVGCVLVLPEWSDWRNGTIWWLHSVYVAPGHRQRGVFTALYRRLAEQVQADPSLKGLRLYVDRRNAAAMAAYRRLGMTDEHYRLFEWLKP